MRLIVGISGASGVAYGIRLLRVLNTLGIESHLVLSRAGEMTLAYETDLSAQQVRALAHTSYAPGDVGAPISSGSFRTAGMIVAPCSIRSMSEIATGATSTLLTRAADVCLKERRRLVLMVRETPLHLGHLRTMTQLAELGAIIAPAMPALYPKPESIDEIVDHTVGRLLDMFGIESGLAHRWRESPGQSAEIHNLSARGKAES
jgi:4-hydroxy-3-polyprenylbenzoate decarboxylase